MDSLFSLCSFLFLVTVLEISFMHGLVLDTETILQDTEHKEKMCRTKYCLEQTRQFRRLIRTNVYDEGTNRNQTKYSLTNRSAVLNSSKFAERKNGKYGKPERKKNTLLSQIYERFSAAIATAVNSIKLDTPVKKRGNLTGYDILLTDYTSANYTQLLKHQHNSDLDLTLDDILHQSLRKKRSVASSQPRHGKRDCSRRSLVIDFERTGWVTGLVYPRRYNAFYCGGKCPSVPDQGFDFTNHAVLQGLARGKDGKMAPRPCCVSTKLRAMSMLYFDGNQKMVVRQHENMIVEKCGCR